MSKKKKTFILKVLPVLAIGIVMLIPAIYACIFLGSMWDPYGKVEDLPVAVVNLDKSVKYNGKSLCVGNDLVEKLRDNKSLKFNFVDKDVAQQGIENGTYYMVITIPKNFSSNATTLMEDNPKKLKLEYKTNPGKNYIASKMSATAIQKLSKGIEDTVTETYTEAVFDKISGIAHSLYNASNATGKLEKGAVTLQAGNTTIESSLKTLYNSSVTFKKGAGNLNNGITTYTDGVTKVNQGSLLLNDGLTLIKTKAPQLTKGISSLSQGADKLSKGVKTYTTGVDKANNGAKKLTKNSPTITSGANQLNSASSSLYTGTSSLKTGLNTLSSKLGKTVTDENKSQLTALSKGLTSLNDGISKLNYSLENTTDSTLETDLVSIGENLKSIGSDLVSAQTGFTKLQQEIQNISQSEWFKNLDPATQQSVVEGLTASATEIGNGLVSIKTNTQGASENLKTAASSASDISKSVYTVKTSVKTIRDNSEKLLPTAGTQITNLYGGLEAVKTTLDNKIITGATQLENGASQLSQGANAFNTGLNLYTKGVDNLAKGTKTLTENSPSLNSGAKKLSAGAKKLNNNAPSLVDGINDLSKGGKSLAAGTKKLNDNSNKLKQGSTQLYQGAVKISDGSLQLYNGSVKLGNGLKALDLGSKALYKGLKAGADNADKSKISDKSKKMFASPVETKETQETTVENNGSAMSAYMMCVGLWVAGLAFCIVTGAESDPKRIKKKRHLWIRKLFELVVFSVGSATVLVLLLIQLNGLNPLSVEKTFLLAIITSMAFSSIIYFFNILLGKIGSFALLVLLVIQLACAGGTYPLALSPEIYERLNPYLPFSHAVEGFRMTIATGQDITPVVTYMAVYIGVFTLLTLITMVIKIKSKKTKEYGLAQLLEEAFA